MIPGPQLPARLSFVRKWVMPLGGLMALLIGAAFTYLQRGYVEESVVVTPSCHVPVTMIDPPTGPQGYAIVFHGLASNRRLMLTLGQQFEAAGIRAYLVDSPGHGDSAEPFSYARTEQCAAETVEALSRREQIPRDDIVLVGHSMGGAIAMRLADRFPTAATIAISPAPMQPVGMLRGKFLIFPSPRRMPVNLLIFAGGLEPHTIALADQALLRAAGGERTADEDFAQKRAAQFVLAPRTSHVGLVFNGRVAQLSVAWARRALGLPSLPHELSDPWRLVMGPIAGFLGLLLLIASCRRGLAQVFGVPQPRPEPASAPSAGISILCWSTVSVAAVLVLQLWVPLKFLRVFTGDYYVSFKLLAGLTLLAIGALLSIRARRAQGSMSFGMADYWSGPQLRALLLSASLGMVCVLALGAWLNWQITDLWMNAGRWLRFLPVVLAGFPFYLAEELTLGPLKGSVLRRWSLFVALRVIVWGTMVTALFVLSSDQILILLLGAFFAVLAVAQRLGADAVRRNTGSAPAAALFSAILGAWFVAAVLPLT